MIVSNRQPIPLYNTKELASLYLGRPKKDERDLLMGIEMVLLAGSKIEVIREYSNGVYEVHTPHYRVDYPVYVDVRHVSPNVLVRKFILPAYEEALHTLSQVTEGTLYVYGANVSEGLPHLLNDFTPQVELSREEKKEWTLEGLDCSGLFFEICQGATLRNCSMLPQIGETIVHPKVKDLRPLDLLIYPGHVVIVESSGGVIESAKRFKGVRRGPLTSKVLEGCRVVRPFFEKVAVPSKLFG